MWIDNKFMTEPELQVHIKRAKEEAFRDGYLKAVDTMAQETAKEMSVLEAERDAYKQELIKALQELSRYEETATYSVHLRLEDLIGDKHNNIC